MKRKIIFYNLFLGLVLLIGLTWTSSLGLASGFESVYRVPIDGDVGPGMVNLVEKGINEAEEARANAIIIELDTYGGLVDSGIRIRDLIFATETPTITYVENRAWSAGALIALAGEKLAMAEGSSIGAAETRPREEKYISALRKEFGATAERRGRDSKLAEAMVDSSLQVPGVIEADKLLSFSASEAVDNQVADLVVADQHQLLEKLALEEARLVTVTPTSAERLAGIVTNPTISVFLLTLGFLGLFLEGITPGWGVGGTTGLVSLGLFFSGYIINGVASWGLIILFLVGVFLLFLELVVIPGFGVTGAGGIICILISLFFVFPTAEMALTVIPIAVILSLIGLIIMIKYFGTSHFWNRISLQKREEGYTATDKNQQDLVGKQGRVITPLRPTGTIEVAEEYLDVVSQGEFIESGREVKIIQVSGSRIIVKSIKEESD
ncbi:ATP-dependent Clp protease proteolytic subunit [Natroniella sulfidigena]|uniref:NfeD family protein n=1 Tax=Natroniella sulfidigena TaxID=723921 RepID=UPI00200B26B7|nr:NfeD family protein [Natroniella sulfidigena]MCK8818046.1 ATP-dependent Clp protease proteolytic subunit [Natroniella sulfidigena]